MKRIFLILFLLVSQILAQDFFLARITFYSDDPRYGRKTSSGAVAQEGKTAAASSKFKYGQRLEIPDLKKHIGSSSFVVQDRGSAVESGKASGGKLQVIDIYVDSHKKVSQLARLKNNVFKVYLR